MHPHIKRPSIRLIRPYKGDQVHSMKKRGIGTEFEELRVLKQSKGDG
jgi:hypothetical protein